MGPASRPTSSVNTAPEVLVSSGDARADPGCNPDACGNRINLANHRARRRAAAATES